MQRRRPRKKMMISNVIVYTVISAIVFVIIGLTIYVLGYADSWQEAFRKMLKWLGAAISKTARFIVKAVKTLYRWGTEDETAAFQRNVSLILSPEEITALIARLTNHPYETPSLEGVGVDDAGIYSVVIGAVGFSQRYRELTSEQAIQITQRLVSEFLRECRGDIPPFYVAFATPYRFLLHIPLSQYGFETLKRRIEQERVVRKIKREGNGKDHLNLQEEVDLPYMLDKQPEDKP